VYDQTKQHAKYINTFKQNENLRTHPPKPATKTGLPNPKLVMKEYVKARDIVNKIQTRYKTEYQRQFLDWNKPISEIKKQLINNMPDEIGASKMEKFNHSEAAGISSGKPQQIRKPRSDLTAVKLPIPKTNIIGKHNSFPVDFTHVQSVYDGLK
jgi:hypothetical protein